MLNKVSHNGDLYVIRIYKINFSSTLVCSILMQENDYKHAANTLDNIRCAYFGKLIFNLFGVLHCFQHCTGHITIGSCKGR